MKRNCEICGSKRKKVIYKHIVQCKDCGFYYRDVVLSEKQLQKYYEEINQKGFYSNKVNELDKKRLSMSLSYLYTYLDTSEKILDIGCEDGRLLERLTFDNKKGLEISPKMVKLAKEKGLDVKLGTIYNTKIKTDFVILTHVLEHIADLDKFIEAVKKTGCQKIYIESPDADNFFIPKDTKNYYVDQYEPFLQFSSEHINYFTKNSLTRLMAKNGFYPEIIKSEVSAIAVICSVWKRVEPSNLLNYVQESKKIMSKIKNKLKGKYYVWGAGGFTQRLIDNKVFNKNVIAFIDNNPYYQGKKLLGKDIIKPEHLENYPIFIASLKYKDEIASQIKGLFKNEILY